MKTCFIRQGIPYPMKGKNISLSTYVIRCKTTLSLVNIGYDVDSNYEPYYYIYPTTSSWSEYNSEEAALDDLMNLHYNGILEYDDYKIERLISESDEGIEL